MELETPMKNNIRLKKKSRKGRKLSFGGGKKKGKGKATSLS